MKSDPTVLVRTRILPLFVAAATAGCYNDETPTAPERPDGALSMSTPAFQTAAAQGYRTIRDEYSDMATRIPGGFGGLYFDDDERLTMLLMEPERAAAARTALALEPYFADAPFGPSSGFDVESTRIQAAQYPHDVLHGWYRQILHALDFSPRTGSIRVSQNQIIIGVANENQLADVERTAEVVGVPGDAIRVDVVAPIHRSTNNLRSNHHSFFPGGVQIASLGGGTCTLGPILEYDGGSYFLINSHCTSEAWSPSHGFLSVHE